MVKVSLLQKGKKGFSIKNIRGGIKGKKNRILNKKSSKQRSKLYRKLAKVAVVIGVILVFVGMIGVVKVFSWLQELDKSLPTPENIFPEGEFATEIFDRIALTQSKETGTRLYRMFGNVNSDPVDLNEIPEILKWSFLAAEDRGFYNHPGFDMQGIIRSVFNLARGNSQTGGASTITQQLVRAIPNTTVGKEVTAERKIKEILMAIKLEQAYSKDQILEMYLRVAPMGSNITGVKTGANFYFGKKLSELTLAECIVLAAIVQNPAYLSPTRSIDPTLGEELLKDRFGYIIGQMEEYKDFINAEIRKNKGDETMADVITTELLEAAKTEDWKAGLKPPIATDKKAGHFVNYVIKELQSRNYYKNERPFTLDELQTGGYTIYTTLDYGLQQAAEAAVYKGGTEYQNLNVFNSAVMTTIPGTGEIITMAGSKSFYGNSEGCDGEGKNCLYDPEVNVMVDALRSPGSTNKPFGYYEAYRQGKIFTGSSLPDVPIKVVDNDGSIYEPKNWNYGFDGVGWNATEMLERSRNMPALFVVKAIGVDRYVELMRSLGYVSYTGAYGLSVILGGVSIRPWEHAQGYGVFANGGDLVRLDPILKIVTKSGEVIYEAKPKREQVGDPQAAYLINQSLNNYNNFSSGYWDGRRMSGKTGTSNDNKDSWFVAYTPDIVTVAWSGNNNNAPLNQQLGWANVVVFPWLGEYLRQIGNASYFSARSDFARPAYVYTGGGGCGAENNGVRDCLGIDGGWLIQDRTPSTDYKMVRVTVCKDQPNKRAREIDIAMGMAETVDKSYWVSIAPEWQKFIDEYVLARYGEPNGGPAANDFCTIDRSGGVNGPFFSNLNGQYVDTDQLRISGGVYSLNGGITDLSFTFDSQSIPGCAVPLANAGNFDITCDISALGLDGGTYVLKATATDAGGITNSSANISVAIRNGISNGFTFTQFPSTPLVWNVDVGNGKTKLIQVTHPGSVSNVQLWQIKDGGTAVNLGAMNKNGNNYRFNWGGTIPNENATYTFYVTSNIGATGTTQSIVSTGVQVLVGVP